MYKMAKQSDGCSGETLLALCTKKRRLQKKMTETTVDKCSENIGMLSKS